MMDHVVCQGAQAGAVHNRLPLRLQRCSFAWVVMAHDLIRAVEVPHLQQLLLDVASSTPFVRRLFVEVATSFQPSVR